MQIIKSFIKLLFFICPVFATAQSTYLNQGSKDIHFVKGWRSNSKPIPTLIFLHLRPFNRKAIVRQAEFLDSASLGYADSLGRDKYWEWTDLDLTTVDEYNLHSFLMNNTEWVTIPKKIS
jgi:hypothetical protein